MIQFAPLQSMKCKYKGLSRELKQLHSFTRDEECSLAARSSSWCASQKPLAKAWAVPRHSVGSAHMDNFHLKCFIALKGPKGKISKEAACFSELLSITKHQISESYLKTAKRK